MTLKAIFQKIPELKPSELLMLLSLWEYLETFVLIKVSDATLFVLIRAKDFKKYFFYNL